MTELTDITALVRTYSDERVAAAVAAERAQYDTIVANLRARIAELEKPAPDWKLIWEDPFNTIDPTIWGVDVSTTYGHANGHEHVNTNRPKNVRIQDNALVVEAHREDPPIKPTSNRDPLIAQYPNGRPYSSGHLKSKKTFTIGDKPMRFEVRAKLPKGPGLLPAPIWLRPTTGGSDGEIDVVESDTSSIFHIVQTAHQQYSPSVKYGKSTTLKTPNTDWHIYAAEVDDTGISFYIDGVFTIKVGKDRLPRYDELFGTPRQWLMHVTNAVGGSWVKSPTAATPFPAAMALDWVRVYEKI